MQFAREIRHVFLALLLMLAALGLSASYWAVAGTSGLLQRDDNPRRIEAQARIQRGAILDRDARPLVQTVAGERALERQYLAPATFSAVGYHSLRYGVGGVEAAFDALLSGGEPDSLAEYFRRHLLRAPQIGADIRLTLDLDMQSALAAAMAGQAGAAVVLDASDGAIRALLSLPSYDPNRLDAEWDALAASAGKPFFNRALQGQYQPGGSMYSLLLAEALAADFDLSTRFMDGAETLALDANTTVACLVPPPQDALTLPEAFVYGCPAPFAAFLAGEYGAAAAGMLESYRFDRPATLDGFPQPDALAPPESQVRGTLDDSLRDALGQGRVTTPPLHLASIMAAIAGDGSFSPPYIHEATRQPETDSWMPAQRESSRFRILGESVAAELRALLRDSWASLADAPTAGWEAGAQLARSQSGEGDQTWLNGYVASQSGERLAFVIVLEAAADIGDALAAGEALLKATAGNASR